MFRLIKVLLLIAFISNISLSVFAQKKKYKYGKVSTQELLMSQYSGDTAAKALILHDVGRIEFKYSNDDGFNVQLNRLLRIKVFKKEGYDQARFEIPLGKTNYGDYKIAKLRATSYTLDADGKIQKTKLATGDIYKEDINKYWEQVKFEVPNITEGCVFEVEYTIDKNSWNIPTWEFQKDVPVLYSDIKVFIPEYFTYKKLQKGYYVVTSDPLKSRKTSFSYKYTDPVPGAGGRKNVYEGTQEYLEYEHHYYADSIPAFISEDYITCSKNYQAAIDFELAQFKPPFGTVRNYTSTWEAISKKLNKDEDFGGQLKHGIFLNEIKDEILASSVSESEKLQKAVSFIKSAIKWNDYNGIYSYNGIRKAYKEGSGNSADINLALVSLLRKLELDAYPVVLSTRGHGFVHPAQLMLEQFNYVIAAVMLDEKWLLIDATDMNLPIGMLPKKCINGQGRIINDKGGSWIDLMANSKSVQSYQLELDLTQNGLQGKVVERHQGYAALNRRNSMMNYNNSEDYFNEERVKKSDFELTLDSIQNVAQIAEPVSIYYEIEDSEHVNNAGNLIMLNPVLLEQVTENPFKLEKREYPVDYAYPSSTSYVATINIPQGYTVENLPKPQRVLMPENGASFLFSIQNAGNKIIVVSRFNINKSTFIMDEYEYLKQFYNKVIDAQSQQIILKKI